MNMILLKIKILTKILYQSARHLTWREGVEDVEDKQCQNEPRRPIDECVVGGRGVHVDDRKVDRLEDRTKHALMR